MHKQLQNGVLHLGQPDPAPLLFQGAVADVHDKGTLGQQLGVCRPISANAAVQGVNPGRQLRRREGLSHIVIRPGHEACHLIHLLGPGSEHDDANLLVGRPDVPANLKSVHIRQHNVQNGNADIRMVPQAVQSLLPGTGLNGIIPGPLQVNDHKAADIDLVFQN